MSKGILAIIGAISAIVIVYFLFGLGDKSTETQTVTKQDAKTVSGTTQIQNNTDPTEQELENELNKIEENIDMELSEEIQ